MTEYLPMFALVRQPRPVTVRHLLGHSSGLANPVPIRWVRPADAPPVDQGRFVERLLVGHRRLRFGPGARTGYSNLGYLVLGEVVAAVTGASFVGHVRARVLAPLGMAHTGFSYADVGDVPRATGYQPVPALLTPLLRVLLPRGVVGERRGRSVAYRPFYRHGPIVAAATAVGA